MVKTTRVPATFFFSSSTVALSSAKRLKAELAKERYEFRLGTCKTFIAQMTGLRDWRQLEVMAASDSPSVKHSVLDRELGSTALVSRRKRQATFLAAKAKIPLPTAYKVINVSEPTNTTPSDFALAFEGKQKREITLLQYRLPRTWSDIDGRLDRDDLEEVYFPEEDPLLLSEAEQERTFPIRVGSNDDINGSTLDFQNREDINFARVSMLRRAYFACDNRVHPILSPKRIDDVHYEIAILISDHHRQELGRDAIYAVGRYLAQVVYRDLYWILMGNRPKVSGYVVVDLKCNVDCASSDAISSLVSLFIKAMLGDEFEDRRDVTLRNHCSRILAGGITLKSYGLQY